MGTNCSSHPGPQAQNACSQSLGVEFEVENFCSPFMEGKRDFCDSISSAGEWEYGHSGGYCYFHDITNYGEGCCHGTCGTPFGSKLYCRRVKFAGDDLTCCFKDFSCSGSCFTDPGQNNTCSPDSRDITQKSCKDKVFDYCTASGVYATDSADEFFNRWLGTEPIGPYGETPCYKALFKNLYAGHSYRCQGVPLGPAAISSEGYKWSQQLFSAMMTKYKQFGGTLFPTPNEGTQIVLNPMIENICSEFPGICELALQDICSGQTINTLIDNIGAQKWCGCYMPDAQYSEYTNVYRIGRQCTPSCNMSGAIPLSNPSGIGSLKCTSNICVIDNISIELYASAIEGGVNGLNFTQLCQSCTTSSAGSCQCTLTGITMEIIDSQIPNLSLNQNCGSGSYCYNSIKDPSGKMISIRVPCSSTSNYNPFQSIEEENIRLYKSAINMRFIKSCLIIVIAVFIIIILWVIIGPSKIKWSTHVGHHVGHATKPQQLPKGEDYSKKINFLNETEFRPFPI
jgi:hypothetical protein